MISFVDANTNAHKKTCQQWCTVSVFCYVKLSMQHIQRLKLIIFDAVNMTDLDKMVAESMKDIPSDAELSDDEDDDLMVIKYA